MSRLLGKVGLGCGGAVAFVLVAYCVSVLFWSWLLMVFMGAFGPYQWSYVYVFTHWGLLVPFVLT